MSRPTDVLDRVLSALAAAEKNRLDPRRATLAQAFPEFLQTLEKLSAEDRAVTLSLLYQRVIDSLYWSHLDAVGIICEASLRAARDDAARTRAIKAWQVANEATQSLYGRPAAPLA